MATQRRRNDLAMRTAGIAGLTGIILVHLADLQSKMSETPYMGWLYVALMIASGGLIVALVRDQSRNAWLLTAALSAGVFAAFVLSRSVGLPGAAGDVGEWGEPIGVISLIVEGLTTLVAVRALSGSGARRTVTA
jgi:uncharacterized membrane protein